MVEELLATGWNRDKLDTLACLGMVDKETLKNFTRSFREEVRIFSPVCLDDGFS